MLGTPFFIMGSPRSGTTLLERFLNGHSQIFVPPETAYFHHLRLSSFMQSEPTKQNIETFVNGYLDTRACHLLNLGDSHVVKDVLLEGATNYQDVFMNLLGLLNNVCGKTRIGEKTPHHLHSAEYILSWFQDTKIICVIRDGRAVVKSRLHHPNWEHNLLASAYVWRNDALRVRTLLEQQCEERVYLLRYERLLVNPESVLGEVCDFLGEKFEFSMLGSTDQKEIPAQYAEYYQQSWMNKSTTKIDLSRTDAWRNEYSSCELSLVERLMASELEYFGYECCARNGYGWLPLLIKESVRHLWFRSCRYVRNICSLSFNSGKHAVAKGRLFWWSSRRKKHH